MIYLTKEQFKFLKKLSKIDKLSDIPKEINPIIRFLEENKFVIVKYKEIPTFDFVNQKNKNIKTDIIYVSIAENGKAYISERKNRFINQWIPYIVTTLLSVLALMKSYGFGVDDLFTWCTQLLKQWLL